MYNKEEIDKNRSMVIRSTDECLTKLAQTNDLSFRKILEERLGQTFALVDFALDSLRQLPQDEYLSEVIGNMEACKKRWEDYRTSSRARAA